MDMTDNRTDHLGQQPEKQAAADNELLEQLFSPLRTMEIADDGFSQRVMQQLTATDCATSRSLWLSRLWTVVCVAIALLLFVAMKGWYVVAWSVVTLLNNPPSPYMLLTLAALMVLTMTIVTYDVVHRYRYSL